MSSPTSCSKCHRQVALVSPGGLCLVCASSADTADPTLRSAEPPPELDLPTATAAPAPPTGTAAPGLATASNWTPAAGGLPNAPAGYDLVSRLGGGGMGEVYLAREHASERLVAMKFLRYPGSPDAVERFLIELRALAQIDHPNVVRLYADDFLRSDPFFTMEYMPRGPVGRGGPLPPAEAVKVVRAVAEALSAAHALQIIHRDLKPSNILLAEDGTAKVADFGLAKRLDADQSLTAASGALGTVQYMPPEQVTSRNGEIGPWSDVFGLGATLYHLLSGRPPFTGDSTEEIILKVVGEHPPRLRDIPARLEGIILKCLEKETGDRYQSMAELIADLDAYTAGQKPLAPPLTRWRRAKRWAKRNRRGGAVAALVLALMAGAAVLGGGLWPKRGTEVAASTAPLDPEAEFVSRGRKTLAEGKRLDLIGETGAPPYSRWRVGPGEVVTLKGENPPFAIAARGYGFLEVFPDPSIDSYTLSGEIQQLEAAGAINRPPTPGLHTVGFYVAHDLHPQPDEGRIHTFGIVTYSDHLPKDASHTQIFYRDLILYERRLQPTIFWPFPVGSMKGDRTADLPGPWRKIDITVSPAAVKVASGRTFAEQDGPALAARSDNFQEWANKNTPGANLAGWSSRRPVGVWVYGSCVAVRNVSITPSTPPR